MTRSTRRRGSWLVLCTLCVLDAACAGVRPKGGSDWPSWREITSAHFILRTNLSLGGAEAASRELERLRSALVYGAFRMDADPPGRLQAVLFRDVEGMTEFADRRVDGYVTSTPSGPLLVSSGADLQASGGEGRVKLLHELAHYLSSFILLRQPRWFGEGLAEYLETLEVSGDRVRLGLTHATNLKTLKKQGALPLEVLWSAEEPGSQASFSFHFYASAWLWYHFLQDKYASRMVAFEEMLKRAEDPTEAFATAFSSVHLDQLEDEVQHYLLAERFAVRVQQVRAQPSTLGIRAMSNADVHAMRAELFLNSPARRTQDERTELAQWELNQALESDPNHVTTTVLRGNFQKAPEKLRAARELVRVHPNDGRAWGFLAGQLEDDPSARADRLAALEQAVRLSPDDAGPLNNLAWEKVTHGDAAVGLQLVMRAIRMAPWSPSILDTYAAALFKVGRCREARVVQQRAVDLLHEQVDYETRQQLLGALIQYRAHCPGPGGEE